MAKIMPDIGTKEAEQFCQTWDRATHVDKLALCNDIGIAYQTGKNYRHIWGGRNFKPEYNVPPDSSWAEHLSVFKQMDKLIAFHQQMPTEISVEIKTNNPIGIAFTEDWQLGQSGVDYTAFEKDMRFLAASKNIRNIIGGDGYQNIIQSSKMGSSHNQMPVAPQKGLYYNTLEMLAENNVCITTGNHNYWSTLLDGEDWDREICGKLKLVYIKHGGLINLKVGKQVYPILKMHQSQFNSSFNLTHTCRQQQRLYYPQSRVIVIGHRHVPEVTHYSYAGNECIAMRPGTYAVYDDYALQNGFFGAHISNPTVVFYPNEDKLVGFKDMRDADIYLKAVAGQ